MGGNESVDARNHSKIWCSCHDLFRLGSSFCCWSSINSLQPLQEMEEWNSCSMESPPLLRLCGVEQEVTGNKKQCEGLLKHLFLLQAERRLQQSLSSRTSEVECDLVSILEMWWISLQDCNGVVDCMCLNGQVKWWSCSSAERPEMY